MTTFLGKLSKNGFLYAFIGLLLVGGVISMSSKIAHAATCSTSGLTWYPSAQVAVGGGPYGGPSGPFPFDPPYTGINYATCNTITGNIGGFNGLSKSEWNSGTVPAFPNFGVPDGDYVVIFTNPNAGSLAAGTALGYTSFSMIGGFYNGTSPPPTDTSTHFIKISPENATTTATTTSVGAEVYANAIDFPNYGRVHAHFIQDSAFACQNSGAVYDAVVTCAGANAPASPIDIDFSTTTLTYLLSGDYTLFETITFGGGGKWTGVFTIDRVSQPWYFLGLFNSYTTLLTQTTHFVVGLPSPMDIVRQAVASSSQAFASTTRTGIGAILASTTASLINACNPFGGFNPGDCLTLTIWPGEQAVSDDFVIIKQTPPWGYVFRVIDLLNATTSTTTLPTIDYSFASTSPMAVMGNIHFDPFGSVAAAGSLIGEMHSDQAGAPTVWTIMMPIVNIFVYLVLAFMIIHDLTGIHWGGDKSKHDDTKD